MNWKLNLFNFKKGLLFEEQDDVANIVEAHLNQFDNFSEKEIFNSLNERLKPHKYFPEVKSLLEGLEKEIDENSLLYNLKDLYKRVDRKNHGEIYIEPINVILKCINKENDDARMESVMNELSLHDWIPEVKQFMLGLTVNPLERQNFINSGKAEKIYTISEKCEQGTLAFIIDSWFLMSENEIKKVLLEDYIKDDNKLKDMRILEHVVKTYDITDDKINFNISEQLVLGVSTNGKELYLNGDKVEKETTLESIFQSTLIPYLKRNEYLVVNTTANNTDKFVELDVALKVRNLLKPYYESIVINYKDKNYIYHKDSRNGTMFSQYENVSELIHDVQKELDYDVTYFFENKLSKELKHLQNLENQEKQIELKLKEVNEAIEIANDEPLVLEENENVKLALKNMLVYKDTLLKSLRDIKTNKIGTRRDMIAGNK